MIEIGICDDDVNDLSAVSKMICEICHNEAVSYRMNSFLSGKDMLEKTHSMDVGILDISMNDMNGIELGRKLKAKFPDIKLIYTTSYKQYCEQVINRVHAFSFLVKPLNYESVRKQFIETINTMENDSSGRKKEFRNLITRNNEKIEALKLDLKDIVYFEYIQRSRTVKIICKNKWYELPYVMRNLEDELNGFGFEVCCRGLLVNMRHIKKIKGYNVYMDNGVVLSVSQRRKKEFIKSVNKFMNNNFN